MKLSTYIKIILLPEERKTEKCLVLVGGSGDTAEKFEPLARALGEKLEGFVICTFTMSSEVVEGESLLNKQTEELRVVMEELVTKFEEIDLFCTSMGAYATVRVLGVGRYYPYIRKVIMFDPADYHVSDKFQFATPDSEITWSGYQEYNPQDKTVVEELKNYGGEATIDMVHLVVRNHGSSGYVEKEYRDRGNDDPGGYPRLNTEMVKRFYENTPEKNRGQYVEVNNLPHGFMRDGDIAKNLERVVDVVVRLIESW